MPFDDCETLIKDLAPQSFAPTAGVSSVDKCLAAADDLRDKLHTWDQKIQTVKKECIEKRKKKIQEINETETENPISERDQLQKDLAILEPQLANMAKAFEVQQAAVVKDRASCIARAQTDKPGSCGSGGSCGGSGSSGGGGGGGLPMMLPIPIPSPPQSGGDNGSSASQPSSSPKPTASAGSNPLNPNLAYPYNDPQFMQWLSQHPEYALGFPIGAASPGMLGTGVPASFGSSSTFP